MKQCRWCAHQISDEQPWSALADHAMTSHEEAYLAVCHDALLQTSGLTDDEACEEIEGLERYERTIHDS